MNKKPLVSNIRDWLINRYGACHVFGLLSLALAMTGYHFISLAVFHVFMVVSAIQLLNWEINGWRFLRNVSILGFFAIGGFYALASIIAGNFYLADKIEKAKLESAYFEDHRDDVSDEVSSFLKSEEEGFVSVLTIPWNASEDGRNDPLTKASKRLISSFVGAYRWTLPSNLGKDPIIPFAATINASAIVIMTDAKATVLSSKEYRDAFDVEQSDNARTLGYFCTIGPEGEVSHLMVMNREIVLLDLTEESEFRPILSACEKYNRLDLSHTDQEREERRNKARKELGLPDMNLTEAASETTADDN